jgi:hypothetical protein
VVGVAYSNVCMGRLRNACEILLKKPEGRDRLGDMRKQEDNIKTNR